MVRTVFHFVGGYFALLFAVRLMVWILVERRSPAYRVSLRRVFLGDPAHYTRNLAPLFSPWDRLFGTYQAPAPAVGKLSFGIGERVRLVRLMTGL